LATLGLIFISPYGEHWLDRLPNWFSWRTFLVATVSTQIAVLPWLAYQIGEVSLIAVVANVLVLPLVPVAMLLTFLAGLLAYMSVGVASLVAYLAYFSLQYIIILAESLSEISFAAIALPVVPVYLVVLGYAFISLVLWYFYNPELNFGYSEIGENWLAETNKTEDSLDDWVIEEELDESIVKEKADESQRDSSAPPPIFFR
jgi:competence protein ComEC